MDFKNQAEMLHYRTGSLEKSGFARFEERYLHYRTGSLEIVEIFGCSTRTLHYRTGSLENCMNIGFHHC